MEKYAIILAGGGGFNFWPRSRERKPKQLLKLFNNKSLLQLTIDRIKDIFPFENIYIVTNRLQKMAVKDQLPEIPEANILDEPFGKKTAASIGFATAVIQKKAGNAVTAVLPCDHIIKDAENYQKAIIQGLEYAANNKSLVTIGIPPEYASTEYGYIQFEDNGVPDNIHNVVAFAEKPTEGTAQRFIESGDFLWNSGIFIWQTDVISGEFREYLPDLYEAVQDIAKKINEPDFDFVLTSVYSRLKSISIDYGIMEHSELVSVLQGNFDWKDIDCFEDLLYFSKPDEFNNYIEGKAYIDSVENSYIYTPSKFTAVLGLDNIAVIDTPDVLLVCDRNKIKGVQFVIDHLRLNDMKHLL